MPMERVEPGTPKEAAAGDFRHQTPLIIWTCVSGTFPETLDCQIAKSHCAEAQDRGLIWVPGAEKIMKIRKTTVLSMK